MHVIVCFCVCVCVCVSVPDALQISVVTTPLQKMQQLDRKPRPLHAHGYFMPSSKFMSFCDVTCEYRWIQPDANCTVCYTSRTNELQMRMKK